MFIEFPCIKICFKMAVCLCAFDISWMVVPNTCWAAFYLSLTNRYILFFDVLCVFVASASGVNRINGNNKFMENFRKLRSTRQENVSTLKFYTRTRRRFLGFEILCAFRLLDNRKGFRGVIFELFTFVGAYCRVPNNRVVGVGIHLLKTK